MLAPRTPASIAWSASAAEVRFDGSDALSARLIVGADGVRSWTRAQAGMRHDPVAYAQTAVVANFACEHAHRGRAFQWFLPDGGVLAWLPLPGRRISMVWSAPDALAAELLALDGGALAERVASTGARALGALTTITAPLSFPLSLLRLPAVIAHRLALVGDAAHGVHPLAGKGSISDSAMRRRCARYWPTAAPSVTPGRRCCCSAMQGGDSSRCSRCRASPMDCCACSAAARRWLVRCAIEA